jgi:anti-sigma B factor antagonist
VDMTIQIRPVTVKQLPENLSVKQRWIFFREIVNCMNVDRPRIVLDCAKVRQLNKPALHLLLRCLEEAMKRNGDVKLAAIPRGAKVALELTGVNRLFEIFDTTADAVNSFHQIPTYVVSQTFIPECSNQNSKVQPNQICMSNLS